MAAMPHNRDKQASHLAGERASTPGSDFPEGQQKSSRLTSEKNAQYSYTAFTPHCQSGSTQGWLGCSTHVLYTDPCLHYNLATKAIQWLHRL